jgi:hypothetical protein
MDINFKNDTCYEIHLKTGVCESLKKCGEREVDFKPDFLFLQLLSLQRKHDLNL